MKVQWWPFIVFTTIELMKRNAVLAGLAAFALILSGCSPSAEDSTDRSAAAERIVSLSPTATETLYEIGAGNQVVAVDSNSNVPTDAPRRDFSGFKPNPEAVLAENPDLVIASDDTNGLGEALDAVGVKLLLLPAATSFEDAYQQVEKIGEATGHHKESQQVVEEMRTGISKAVQEVPEKIRNSRLSYFHEADPSLYSAGGGTFIGQAYGLLGLKSIAGDSADYPQLSNEAVIAANPDFIFLADHGSAGGVTPEAVSARPGWKEIDAVKSNRIEPLDPDLASRWGPRLPELIRSIATALKAYQPAHA